MRREERISHAEQLEANPSWNYFVEEMKKLLELANSQINASAQNNHEHSLAFQTGFKMGLETAINFPERTIKLNRSILEKMKAMVEEVTAQNGARE